MVLLSQKKCYIFTTCFDLVCFSFDLCAVTSFLPLFFMTASDKVLHYMTWWLNKVIP